MSSRSGSLVLLWKVKLARDYLWSPIPDARCITDPSIPNTEGCKRPIRIVAPAGTLVNAQWPAACIQRMVVCHPIVDLVMGALSDAVPDRVIADSCGCMYNDTSAHRDERNGQCDKPHLAFLATSKIMPFIRRAISEAGSGFWHSDSGLSQKFELGNISNKLCAAAPRQVSGSLT
jgi:hypothetical protein